MWTDKLEAYKADYWNYPVNESCGIAAYQYKQ